MTDMKALLGRLGARLRHERRGVTSVEMAIIAPVLLMATTGLIEVGRFSLAYYSVNEGLRQAAREVMFNSDEEWDTGRSPGDILREHLRGGIGREDVLVDTLTPANDTPGQISAMARFRPVWGELFGGPIVFNQTEEIAPLPGLRPIECGSSSSHGSSSGGSSSGGSTAGTDSNAWPAPPPPPPPPPATSSSSGSSSSSGGSSGGSSSSSSSSGGSSSSSSSSSGGSSGGSSPGRPPTPPVYDPFSRGDTTVCVCTTVG